jgi:uncharacterized protein (DUF427 family)
MTQVESAWPSHPDYEIDWQPVAGRVRVWQGDSLLAESERALRVTETDHVDVIYLPLVDLNLALFTATDHHTVCPFKGEASYYSLTGTDEPLENVVWWYPTPMAEVEGIAEHAAFYTDRVRLELAG